ncbi:MAG: hypothetical protein ACMUIE_07715, partial [Thermoplasmatota archaeon]
NGRNIPIYVSVRKKPPEAKVLKLLRKGEENPADAVDDELGLMDHLGIDRFMVNVTYNQPGTREVHSAVKGEIINTTYFSVSWNLRDGYIYNIEVSALSGSGVSTAVRSIDGTRVDLNRPQPPWNLQFEHKEAGSLEYELTWSTVEQTYLEDIQHFEVWTRKAEGEWQLAGTSKENITVVKRPLGHLLEARVRAVDSSGQISDFSHPTIMENIAPDPKLIISEHVLEGASISMDLDAYPDIDGSLSSCIWIMEGRVISIEEYLMITLPEGDHHFTLEVADDVGAQVSRDFTVRVEASTDFPAGSFSDYIRTSQIVDMDLEPVVKVHYSNNTILLQDNSTSEGPRTKQELFKASIITTGSILLLLIIFSALGIVVRDVRLFVKRKRKRNIIVAPGADRTSQPGPQTAHRSVEWYRNERQEALSRFQHGEVPASRSQTSLPWAKAPLTRANEVQWDEDIEELEEWDVEEYKVREEKDRLLPGGGAT